MVIGAILKTGKASVLVIYSAATPLAKRIIVKSKKFKTANLRNNLGRFFREDGIRRQQSQMFEFVGLKMVESTSSLL